LSKLNVNARWIELEEVSLAKVPEEGKRDAMSGDFGEEGEYRGKSNVGGESEGSGKEGD
jgi:hypothetical protein